MEINLNIKLSHHKDSDYNINVDIDPEPVITGIPAVMRPLTKSEVGAIKRPDAERLNKLRHPELIEEDQAATETMDKLELE